MNCHLDLPDVFVFFLALTAPHQTASLLPHRPGFAAVAWLWLHIFYRRAMYLPLASEAAREKTNRRPSRMTRNSPPEFQAAPWEKIASLFDVCFSSVTLLRDCLRPFWSAPRRMVTGTSSQKD